MRAETIASVAGVLSDPTRLRVLYALGKGELRVWQILSLLRLAPQIQEHILNAQKSSHAPGLAEGKLRSITRIEGRSSQLKAFGALNPQCHYREHMLLTNA